MATTTTQRAVEPVRCVMSFVGRISGRQIQFTYNEVVAPDHPAVRKWPQFFGPLETRIEQATAAPGEKR